MLLKDKVSLITGGAQGIGKEIALLFLKEGSKVCILDVKKETLTSTQEEFKSLGFEVLGVEADITDSGKVREAVNICLDRYKRIDILVNNAGITQDKLLVRMKEEEWDKVLNVNLKGAFLMCKEVLPVMMRQREGRIINISSIIGLIGNIGQTNYSASKAGLIGLTKSLAKEVGSRNILVNAVCPGYIKTQMTENLPQEYKQKLIDNIYLKRLGTPQDVAGCCLFLASPYASYITGQVLVVDGGLSL